MPTKPAARSPRSASGSSKAGSAATKGDAKTLAMSPNEDERRQMIAVAAYFRAERRGFAPGNPLEDWANAEAEIARMFPR